MNTITEDVLGVGADDREVRLFEGQYHVKNGMAYHSYVILDEKIAVLDTVDAAVISIWMKNLSEALAGKTPHFLIIQHMEPDHSAGITLFMKRFPEAIIVSSERSFEMMYHFFGEDYEDRRILVGDGDILSLGRHALTFLTAPMVHWPEVIMTYDRVDKILFSADGFGRFGPSDAGEWLPEARRYYFAIIGKYGTQVLSLLKKTERLEIHYICPLHGTVLDGELSRYFALYRTWASYEAEEKGVMIAYTSVYGNTRLAAEMLRCLLLERGCPNVVLHDLARADMAEAIADAFRFDRLVLASTTYNGELFPFMRIFLHGLCERGFRRRTVGFIENGSWSAGAMHVMKKALADQPFLTYLKWEVHLRSALHEESREALVRMADALMEKEDVTPLWDDRALFCLGYGLYLVSVRDEKDNGIIVNTIFQVTDTPCRIIVAMNKKSLSHDMFRNTGVANVNILDRTTPFSLIDRFGFISGREKDKWEGFPFTRTENGLAVPRQHVCAVLSLSAKRYFDLGTHGMFFCSVTASKLVSEEKPLTYDEYHTRIKPRTEQGKKGFVCRVCGFVYEGETLPPDYVCPLCGHGASAFEPL